MRVLYLIPFCLLLCGCLGAVDVPEKPTPVQTTIEIQEVRKADFSDKEPQKSFSWVMTICLAGTLFLVPVIMLKGTRI